MGNNIRRKNLRSMKSKFYKLIGIALTVVLLASLTVGLAGAPAGAASSNLKFTKFDLPQVGADGDYWCTPDTNVGPIATSSDGDLFASLQVTAEPIIYTVTTAIDAAAPLIVDITYISTVNATAQTTTLIIPAGAIIGATGAIALATADSCYDVTLIAANAGNTATAGIFDVDGFYSGATYCDYDIAGPTFNDYAVVAPLGYELVKSTDGGYSWDMQSGFRTTAAATGAGDATAIVDIVTSKEYADDETLFVATTLNVFQSVDGGDTFAAMIPGWTPVEIITDMDVTMDDKDRVTIMVGTANPGFTGDVYIYGSKTLAWTRQGIDDGTLGANTVNVLAVGFSPFFDGDEFFGAVVTNPTPPQGLTVARFAITPSTDPLVAAPWGVTYGDAPMRDAVDNDFLSTSARMVFPEDFSAGGTGNNVLFLGIFAGATGIQYDPVKVPTLTCELGDVYKVNLAGAPFYSGCDDLDIRGESSTLMPTATNIVSIDVAGNAEDCDVLVGTNFFNPVSIPAYLPAYHSEDAGATWMPSFKAPTGGLVEVLMSNDYLDSGVSFAGTMGNATPGVTPGTSGFSRSPGDFSTTFNQVSLVDYGDVGAGFAVAWLSATGYNAANTLNMVTATAVNPATGQTTLGGALWQTTNGGENWERVYSYGNTAEQTMTQVWRVGDETIFTVDFGNNAIWRSSDMGATWFKKITITKPGVFSTVSFVSETELWTGFADGSMWWSTDSGSTWDKPEENPMNTAVLMIVPMGPNVIISAINGVFFSSDGGETVARVGSPGEPVAGMCVTMPDLAFGENNMVYTVSMFGAAGAGVWRSEIDFTDPNESEWVRIDNGAGAYNPGAVVANSAALCFPPSGILYVVDGAPVDNTTAIDTAGGLWRCTNPTADVDGPAYPYFETENKGLAGNGAVAPPPVDDTIAFASFDLFPTTIFCGNAAAANYWEQLVMFTDILDVGPPLVMPGDSETGVGLLPEGQVYPNVAFAWQEMAGATMYELQVGLDPDFKSRLPSVYTNSLGWQIVGMNPNMTYYWRVRTANITVAPNFFRIGAPLISPWSDTYKFKTAIGASMARPRLEAPENGEFDIPLSPTFEWSGIEWAETYEYELGLSPTTTAGGYFAEPLVALVGTNALVSTAWKCDTTLDYTTRYYWHVKAVGVDTDTPWSDVGTFTTMGVPPAPTTEGPPVVIPPAEQITPAWIWAIVIIGAILVIAVIVLIVTTRRVP